MSATTLQPDTSAANTPELSQGRRWLWLPVVIVAAALVGSSLYWMTHPNWFSYGNSQTVQTVPHVGVVAAVVQTTWAPSGRTAHISAAVPVVGTNTAHSIVTVIMCPNATQALGMIMAAQLARACPTVDVMTTAGWTFVPSRNPISVIVTPTRPGVTVINGVRLTYSAGLQFGTQVAGIQTTVYSK